MYFFSYKKAATAILYFEYGTVKHLKTLRMATLICLKNSDLIS